MFGHGNRGIGSGTECCGTGDSFGCGAEQGSLDLLAEIWQNRLKHSPEFASTIGDKRYNDQLTDYSAKEVNAALQRGRSIFSGWARSTRPG